MRDHFKPVLRGDRLKTSAEIHNRTLSTIASVEGARPMMAGRSQGRAAPSGLGMAYNASGFDVGMWCVVELATRLDTNAQIEFVKPGGANGQGIYGITIEPIPIETIGLIAVAGGYWHVATGVCAVGDQIGPVDGAWAASASADEMVWEVLRAPITGIALVRFLGGGGTPPVYLEARTSDPVGPVVGEMWLRTDL